MQKLGNMVDIIEEINKKMEYRDFWCIYNQ